jgi:hypothetical protein
VTSETATLVTRIQTARPADTQGESKSHNPGRRRPLLTVAIQMWLPRVEQLRLTTHHTSSSLDTPCRDLQSGHPGKIRTDCFAADRPAARPAGRRCVATHGNRCTRFPRAGNHGAASARRIPSSNGSSRRSPLRTGPSTAAARAASPVGDSPQSTATGAGRRRWDTASGAHHRPKCHCGSDPLRRRAAPAGDIANCRFEARSA